MLQIEPQDEPLAYPALSSTTKKAMIELTSSSSSTADQPNSSTPPTTTTTTTMMKGPSPVPKEREMGIFDENDPSNLQFPVSSSRDLRTRPQFVEKERIPVPTKADFAFLESRRISRAVTAALSVVSEKDAKEFLRDIGIDVLFIALESFAQSDNKDGKMSAVKAICRIVRQDNSIADHIADSSSTINVLIDMMEYPIKGFRSFRMSQQEKEKSDKAQREALALILRLVRSSDRVPDILGRNKRLRAILLQIVAQGEIIRSPNTAPAVAYKATSTASLLPPMEAANSGGILSYVPFFSSRNPSPLRPEKKFLRGNSTIVDYPDLKTHQMARVAAWGLGGVPWKQPGQKGLRILSLDGGGTKGVLSIALLKELMTRVGNDKPHEVFDIICGTSTGGIIATLLGIQMRGVEEVRISSYHLYTHSYT